MSSVLTLQFNGATLEFDESLLAELGLRVLKKGQEYTPDENQVIYRYLLKQDIEKLRPAYENELRTFLKSRENDANYVQLTSAKPFGSNGRFIDVTNATLYNQWKMTSKPYGEIAHKHYLKWVENLPKGPSAEVVRDQDFEFQVKELWDDIRFNRINKTAHQKEQEALAEKEREKKMKEGQVLFNEEEVETENQRYQRILNSGNFEQLRPKISKFEKEKMTSIPWDRGIVQKFNIEKDGLPAVNYLVNSTPAKTGTITDVIKFKKGDEVKPSSYIDPKDTIQRKYDEWNLENNLINAGSYIQEVELKRQEALELERNKLFNKSSKKQREILEQTDSVIRSFKSSKSAVDSVALANSLNKSSDSSVKATILGNYFPSWLFRKSRISPSMESVHPELTLMKNSNKSSLVSVFSSRQSSGRTINPKPDELIDTNKYLVSDEILDNILKIPKAKVSLYQRVKGIFYVDVSEEREIMKLGQGNTSRLIYILREYKNEVEKKNDDKFIEMLFNARDQFNTAEESYREWEEFFYGSIFRIKPTPVTVDDLIAACRTGKYNTVIDILEDNYSSTSVGPNSSNEYGETPLYNMLMMILKNDNYLLTYNLNNLIISPDFDIHAEIEEMESKKSTFFQRFKKKKKLYYSWTNMELILQLLLYKRGNLDYIRKGPSDTDHLSIMHRAAEFGSTIMVSWLISRGANMYAHSTLSKRTPLSFAVENDHIDVVLLLLRKGAVKCVDEPDAKGWTCLHYAAAFASIELTKVLLMMGANSKVRNKNSYRPFEEAQIRERFEMVTMLTKFNDPVPSHLKRLRFLDDYYENTIPGPGE